MWAVQATALVGVVWTAAWLGHDLGRRAERRAWLRRVLVRRGVLWTAVGLVSAAAVIVAVLPGRQSMPRRYGDYMPNDRSLLPWSDPLPGAVAAALLGGSGAVLIMSWAWLRFGGRTGGRRSWPRYGVPGAGGALLAAGLISGWVADSMQPAAFGWFLYAPMSNSVVAPNVNDQPRILHGVAAALTVLGLSALTAMAAFRMGRKETAGPGRP